MSKFIAALLCITVIFSSLKTHTLAVMPSDVNLTPPTAEDDKEKGKGR